MITDLPITEWVKICTIMYQDMYHSYKLTVAQAPPWTLENIDPTKTLQGSCY